MKSYSLELVQRKSGSGAAGKTALAALAGIGAYYGYKWWKKDRDEKKTTSSSSVSTYDLDAQEGESFTERVLRAARRVIK